ncbi:tRNA (adenosine(37)-N6)-dimethylallyltransferase MiaA [Micrococcales bacterium 31B]|nr:tRNA (adenosine(37)-N6)-dimethylallyltransferase MiaA [Micrococcales bacterium 31B]
MNLTLHNLTPVSQCPEHRPLLAIVGPTASGKSDLAIEVALAVDGEVINADAMQFYRGMTIGTARVSEAETRGVPHHLLAHLDLGEEASVAAYQAAARHVANEIRARGHLPILVGGSGLYVRAVTDAMNFPGTDAKVRATLEAEAERIGVQPLFRRLAEADPAAAAAIEPRNVRRVIRALEVIEITGQPFSANLPTYTYFSEPTLQIGLTASRPTLDRRIHERVQTMLERGLVDEVRGLDALGLRNGVTASRAIGYQQVLRHLDGDLTLDAAAAEIVQTTQRLVRKQETWFKRDPRITWLDLETPADRDHVLRTTLEAVQRNLSLPDPPPARPVE